LLRKSGCYFHTSAEKEIVRTIKEKTCYISQNPTKEEEQENYKHDEYKLPDGNIIKVDYFENFIIKKYIFNKLI